MQAVYKMSTEELDVAFLDSLKSMFKNREIEIYIRDSDEIEDFYLQSDKFKSDREKLQIYLKDYNTNGIENFSEADPSFWSDTKKRLLQRHKKAI